MVERQAVNLMVAGSTPASSAISTTLVVRHSESDFGALLTGQAAMELGARVVSICPYEMRDGRTKEVFARKLLIWMECPKDLDLDLLDKAIVAAHCKAGVYGLDQA